MNSVIPCGVVLWKSGNGCVFELNVIYHNIIVINGLSSVPDESRIKDVKCTLHAGGGDLLALEQSFFLYHGALL